MSEYYYYGLAALMYVATCLMFAAVRGMMRLLPVRFQYTRGLPGLAV